MLTRGRHLITEHEPGAGLCDDNPGVYWRLWWLSWGYYRNSHSKPLKPLISRWFGIAIDWAGMTYSAGLVTGYPRTILLPYCSLSEVVSINGRKHRLFFIPRTPLNGSAVHAAEEE